MITTQEPTTSEMPGHVAPYYHLLYADKDFQAEADYVASLLDTYGDRPQSILAFGSRTGKCELALAEMGYEVAGIERNDEMVGLAEARSREPGRFPISDFRFPIGGAENSQPAPRSPQLATRNPQPATFDAVIFLDRAFSYHTRDSDLSTVFDNAAQHLETGGFFLFDVWYAPAVLSQGLETRVQRVADERVELTCITEPYLCSEWNCLQLVYTLFVRDKRDGRIREFSEMHTTRYFTIPEIKTIADCRGFDVVRPERWLTGQLPCTDTRGACFVARKQ